MRLGLRRLLTTMSAMENKGPSMLASPKTQDPLFRRIEDVHEDLRKPYGRILDAGTGGHSLKWLATLPNEAVDCITAVTACVEINQCFGCERRGTGIATPSSRRRVDCVEVDATMQHEHAVKF